MSDTPDVLEVPKLATEPPAEWQKLPEVLLREMTPQEVNRWIAKELALVTQKQDWMIRQICELGKAVLVHQHQIATWKRRVESPALVVIGIFVWLIPVWFPKVYGLFAHVQNVPTHP